METIYNKNEIVEKINEISDKIEEKIEQDEIDDEEIRNLIYAQFIQGLKLSTM